MSSYNNIKLAERHYTVLKRRLYITIRLSVGGYTPLYGLKIMHMRHCADSSL